MSELAVLDSQDQSIPAKLDVAKRALSEATTDWERIDIRDYARAVAAATAILQRKDIQIQAANLVQDAERAIVKANPPISEEERAKRIREGMKPKTTSRPSGAKSDSQPLPITSRQLNHMRQAHKDLSDEEYEEKKVEAIQTGVPLTQRALREEARWRRQQEQLEDQLSLPLAEKPKIRNTVSPEKRLNDLTAKEWIKFTKSWFVLGRGRTDRKKLSVHPATFPAELAEDYIGFFTKEGECVLDPFLGSGTTMEVAEQMGRLSVGIELEPLFAGFARTRTSAPIIVGDALEHIHDTETFFDESFDYVLTSPPYWNTLHKSRGGNSDTRHKKRRERGESLVYSDKAEDLGNIDNVDEYMKQLLFLFKGIHRILKPNRYMTIIIQNLNYEGALVPIAWKLGILLAETGLWKMKGERIWCKEQGQLGIYGYPTTYATNNFHHYCLTFQRRQT